MIGQTLHQYVITGRLGQGGMGEVWLARDTTLDREVALKVLPQDSGDTAMRRERFIREAKAASALNHPNIVTIYEINADHGVDFIAMEYVRGATLATYLHNGPLPIAVVENVAKQVADAVGRAHRAGIVHRDLKPGNIMVTDEGLVKVLDFGIAKMTNVDGAKPSDAATKMTITRAGMTVGTVGYMSPEQAIGDAVDARADVFSFGVIVYEMLAGRLPFAGKTFSEVLRELHFVDPPSLVALRPETPPLLRDVVSRALEKQPANRFANLSEVARALAGEPLPSAITVASPIPQLASGSIERSRTRAPVIGSVITVVVVSVGIGWWMLGDHESGTPGIEQAAAPFEPGRAVQEAALLLTRPDREENVERAIALLDRVVAADPASAIAYAHLSTAYLRRQQATPDPQWLNLSREHARRAIEINSDLAAGWTAMGFVELAARDYATALQAFERAADLDPKNAFPEVGRAMVFSARNEQGDAEAAFTRALTLGPQEWRTHGEFAQFHFRNARYADAARHWENALKLTPDNVLVLRNLGAAYYLLDRPEDAASILQRALEVRPTAPVYTNLGTIRFFQGRYADAVAAFEKAVELSATNPQFWANLGDGLRWAPGRRAEAPAAYRRAISLITEQLAKKSGDADLESRHALYVAKAGDAAAARTAAERLWPREKLTAQMLYRLTVIYELVGERARALDALQRALAAGYPVKDLASEPELTAMRADVRYQRLLTTAPSGAQ